VCLHTFVLESELLQRVWEREKPALCHKMIISAILMLSICMYHLIIEIEEPGGREVCWFRRIHVKHYLWVPTCFFEPSSIYCTHCSRALVLHWAPAVSILLWVLLTSSHCNQPPGSTKYANISERNRSKQVYILTYLITLWHSQRTCQCSRGYSPWTAECARGHSCR
jgi:hypothetical protein